MKTNRLVVRHRIGAAVPSLKVGHHQFEGRACPTPTNGCRGEACPARRHYYGPTKVAFNPARSTSFPRRYTLAIFLELVIFSSGFASSTMKSALLPAATVPS